MVESAQSHSFYVITGFYPTCVLIGHRIFKAIDPNDVLSADPYSTREYPFDLFDTDISSDEYEIMRDSLISNDISLVNDTQYNDPHPFGMATEVDFRYAIRPVCTIVAFFFGLCVRYLFPQLRDALKTVAKPISVVYFVFYFVITVICINFAKFGHPFTFTTTKVS